MTATARVAMAVCLVAGVTASAAASQFDPRYRFHELTTTHFSIYYHQGEDRLAARLASIAEETWRALVRPFGVLPPKFTHVVLVDQTELSNGYATPFPRDAIVIYAVWPTGSDFLKTDDWLRLVFTHEFTHIVHLDRSEGWVRPLRTLFGRVPLAFPNNFLPTWQIEGIATYEESAITGEGRLNAGDFRAILDEAARARRLEPIDRVNGGLTSWPGGTAAYAYGAAFHAYLAQRYGADSLAALAEFTARELPFLGSLAFEQTYGRPLAELWQEFESSLAAESATPSAGDQTPLTRHGFIVTGPRFAAGPCPTCAGEIWYSVETPDEFPAIYRVAAEGGTPQRIARRYLGSTLGMGQTTIYFDQQDLVNNVGLYSDLYTLDRASGRVRRLTHGARLVDPDLSPDGRTIVAAQNRAGARDLALIDVGGLGGRAGATEAPAIAVIASAPDTQFNAPRWSPDGQSIVVERHRPGAQSEIVLVDVATRAIRIVAADDTARWVTPAWRPDGRAIVAAADFNRESFNLYEIDLARLEARPLTHVTGGATSPDVSPDGTTLLYVGYTAGGFEVFKTSYPRSLPTDVFRATRTATSDTPVAAPDESALARARRYTPWATLRPTSWWPILETSSAQTRVGATTSGSDVLGYHAYSAAATWGLTGPASAPVVGNGAPDWQLSYVYTRWRPAFFAAASRDTSFFAGLPNPDGTPSTAAEREHVIETGVIWPVAHVRIAQRGQVSVRKASDTLIGAGGEQTRDRSAARLAWSLSSAHVYGNSISPEGGVTTGVTWELIRRGLGASANASAITGDARAYLPGLSAHHVVAVRLSGGVSTGDNQVRRAFLLGGGGPDADPTGFASDAFSLLRGFPAASFGGFRAALLNVDYRWPVARVERGWGAWPIFLHTIHAAVFVDTGHTWTTAFDRRDLKTSVGAELAARVTVGYRLPLTAALGAAWGHDGSHVLADRVTIYARLGYAF